MCAVDSISSVNIVSRPHVDLLRFIHSCFFTVQTCESDVIEFSGPRTVTAPKVWLSIKYLDTYKNEEKDSVVPSVVQSVRETSNFSRSV